MDEIQLEERAEVEKAVIAVMEYLRIEGEKIWAELEAKEELQRRRHLLKRRREQRNNYIWKKRGKNSVVIYWRWEEGSATSYWRGELERGKNRFILKRREGGKRRRKEKRRREGLKNSGAFRRRRKWKRLEARLLTLGACAREGYGGTIIVYCNNIEWYKLTYNCAQLM